jgi:hypothetical protein
MTHLDPKRAATRAELRSFGLLVGGVFLAIAGVILWRRGTTTVFAVLTTLGGSLLLAGALIPAKLERVYTVWMRLAVLLSRITTPILMGAIYFGVLTPIGLAMRLFGRQPLARNTGWVTRPPGMRRSALERQF